MPDLPFKIIHHVDRAAIEEMYREYSPVFVLSTGRAGSKFMAALLDCAANVTAYHEPRPTLQYFSDYAYHHQDKKNILINMVDAARMEAILDVFIKNRIYVESNQCLTFFAPVTAELFRASKFVHVVRHPGDFVRSAVRKGWHKNDSIWEAGRVKMADTDRWAQLDHIEKLAWVWTATNLFIEEFKTSINSSRVLTLKIEDLSGDKHTRDELFQFVGAREIPLGKIEHLLDEGVNKFRIGPNEPPNIKKVRDFPAYPLWEEDWKTKLKTAAGTLAGRYRYTL